MEITQAFERIDRFLLAKKKNSGGQVYIVNVSNLDALSEIRAKYMYRLLKASSLCREDHLLGRYDLINALCKRNESTVLMEFTSLWKLYGYRALAEELIFLQDYAFAYPLVIVGYKIEESLRILAKDPRREQRIIWIEWDGSNLPQIEPSFVWLGHNVAVQTLIHENKFCTSIEGIQNIAKCVEDEKLKFREYGKKVLVYTQARKSAFPECTYQIIEIDTPFDVVVMHDEALSRRDASEGTAEQWLWLLQKMDTIGRFEQVVKRELGIDDISQLYLFDRYDAWSMEQRWLHWLALKQYGTNQPYLSRVMEKTTDYRQLIRNLYRQIAEVSPTAKEFEKLYQSRYVILRSMQNMEAEASDFAQWIMQKEADALYYMTDLSRHEREAILSLISRYMASDSPKALICELDKRCPILSDYVKPCMLTFPYYIDKKDQEDIRAYFDEYRYLKLVNRMDAEFAAKVVEESECRRFYRFKPRDTRLEEVVKEAEHTRMIAYFVDALGIEFIPYLLHQEQKENLCVRTEILQANLPTVTKYNTKFRDVFEGRIQILDAKAIDNLKHKPVADAQYKKTDVPIYLLDELEEIDKLIKESKRLLNSGNYERVLWVSDHGASRLAVLSQSAERIVSTKGEHGGRYCVDCPELKNVGDVVRTEIEGEKYCVSASYGRLGGRRPMVEVHGGATLEEVLVPLIELSLPSDTKRYEISLKKAAIEFSKRQPAVICLFSKTPLAELSIRFVGGRCDGCVVMGETSDNQNYQFDCSFIKSSGTYTFEVFYQDRCIYSDSFKAENAGMRVKQDDFF
ncbi:MAG: BREX-4 system phosphatase PglZ [Proteobacteria bacterium]|nr:BREX-4 system phosphatase PglZ [Pseudomonadota bacterium]